MIIVILLGASVPVVASVGTAVERHAPAQNGVKLTYSVIGYGTSRASSITYQATAGGGELSGTVQETDAPLPWTRTVVTSSLKTPFFVSVQNGSVGLSRVICSISENGTVLSSNTAEGPAAFAYCSAGRLGKS